ncbi:MAG: class II aldolase/adducin family protein [Candidatus Brocadiae bacterium]|nr:class II aldolase/adducin family protein [Candidatus Brocadiia bacterium]
MKTEIEIREEICNIGHRLYSQNYIVGTDGNMSARLPGNVLLFTPSGVCKGNMTPEQILKTDMEGNKIAGQGKPSSEIQMHLMVYKHRPDVRAVVHAHPPFAVSLTIVGESLEKVLIPEVIVHLGSIPTAPYQTPGSLALAQSLCPFLEKSDTILLARHGIVAFAETLTQAYYKLECAEYAAKIAGMVRQMGGGNPLPASEIEILQEIRNKNKRLL